MIGLVALSVSACASDLQTKVAGNLMSLSKNQTVAILPIETSDTGQKEMAKMFRMGLYANLKQSKFQLLERYVIDGLLQQNKLLQKLLYILPYLTKDEVQLIFVLNKLHLDDLKYSLNLY